MIVDKSCAITKLSQIFPAISLLWDVRLLTTLSRGSEYE